MAFSKSSPGQGLRVAFSKSSPGQGLHTKNPSLIIIYKSLSKVQRLRIETLVIQQGGLGFAGDHHESFFHWCIKNLGHLKCFHPDKVDLTRAALAKNWAMVDYYLQVAPHVLAKNNVVLEKAVFDPECALEQIHRIFNAYLSTQDDINESPRGFPTVLNARTRTWNELRELAAASNRLDVFTLSVFGEGTQLSYTTKTIINAVEGGSVQILDVIAAHIRCDQARLFPMFTWCRVWDVAFQRAVGINSMSVMKWMVRQRALIGDHIFTNNYKIVIHLDALEMFKVIHSSIDTDYQSQLTSAVKAGAIKIVRFLVLEKGAKIELVERIYQLAVTNGHFRIAEYAHQCGCDITGCGARFAAIWDVPSHLDYLESRSIPYDRSLVLHYALKHGSVGTLQHQHNKNPLPMDICFRALQDEDVIHQAASIRWALNNGVFRPSELGYLESIAMKLFFSQTRSAPLSQDTVDGHGSEINVILELIQQKMVNLGLNIRLP